MNDNGQEEQPVSVAEHDDSPLPKKTSDDTDVQGEQEGGDKTLNPDWTEANLPENTLRQILKFENGKVAFKDIIPKYFRKNGNIPLAMLVGWGMSQEAIGNTSKALVDNGQRVMPIDFIGYGEGVEGPEGSFDEINRQAELLKDWILTRPEAKIRLLGQSLASITLLTLLERHPEIADRIKDVILVSPMGLAGDPEVHTEKVSNPEYKPDEQIKKGFTQKIIDKAAMALGGEALYQTLQRKAAEDKRNHERPKTPEDFQVRPKVEADLKSFMIHHPWRATKEGLALAQADVYHLLPLFKKYNIPVALLQGDLDKLNSNRGVWKKIGEGSQNAFKELSEEDYEKDKDEYDKRGIKPGDNVFNRDVQNEAPPIDSIVMTGGGHEIHGREETGVVLIKVLEGLDDPVQEGGDTLEARMKEKDRLQREKELAEVREKLRGEVGQEAPEAPDGSQ